MVLHWGLSAAVAPETLARATQTPHKGRKIFRGSYSICQRAPAANPSVVITFEVDDLALRETRSVQPLPQHNLLLLQSLLPQVLRPGQGPVASVRCSGCGVHSTSARGSILLLLLYRHLLCRHLLLLLPLLLLVLPLPLLLDLLLLQLLLNLELLLLHLKLLPLRLTWLRQHTRMKLLHLLQLPLLQLQLERLTLRTMLLPPLLLQQFLLRRHLLLLKRRQLLLLLPELLVLSWHVLSRRQMRGARLRRSRVIVRPTVRRRWDPTLLLISPSTLRRIRSPLLLLKLLLLLLVLLLLRHLLLLQLLLVLHPLLLLKLLLLLRRGHILRVRWLRTRLRLVECTGAARIRDSVRASPCSSAVVLLTLAVPGRFPTAGQGGRAAAAPRRRFSRSRGGGGGGSCIGSTLSGCCSWFRPRCPFPQLRLEYQLHPHIFVLFRKVHHGSVSLRQVKQVPHECGVSRCLIARPPASSVPFQTVSQQDRPPGFLHPRLVQPR